MNSHRSWRRLLVMLAALVAAAGVAAGGVQSSPVPKTSHIVKDRQRGCHGAFAAGVRRWLETEDAGETLTLRVRVLLNGISLERAREVFGVVNQIYVPGGIVIDSSFEPIRFAGPDPVSLMNEAKAHYGGEPPPEVDAVYVLSRESGAAQGSKVGQADCIGGMLWRDRAFAAGPDWTVEEYRTTNKPGMSDPHDPAGLTAAHEIGHLLGGVHEYGDCADAGGSRPCDVMQSRLPMPFVALRFSEPNWNIVRSTARAVIAARQP